MAVGGHQLDQRSVAESVVDVGNYVALGFDWPHGSWSLADRILVRNILFFPNCVSSDFERNGTYPCGMAGANH